MDHGPSITSVALSPDGLLVATAGDNQTVQVWNAATSKSVGPPLQLKEMIVGVAFAGGDRLVTVTRNVLFEVRIQATEISTGKPASESVTTQTSPLSVVAISPDGRLAATANLDSTLTVWDIGNARPKFPPRKLPALMTKIRFSPKGDRVAAFIADGTVRVWECVTGKETAQLRHGAPLHHLEFSPDGRRLATAGLDGVVHISDATSGKNLITLRHGPAFTHGVNYVAFSPDGLHAVTAGADNTARVWDVTTGTATYPPLPHGGKTVRASFGRDGRRIMTASADRVVRVWDLASGQLATPPLEHEDAVAHASFDPTGRRAVTAGADRVAWVWDLASGRTQGPPLVHVHKLRYAAFAADGRIVTAGENNNGGVGEASVLDTAGKLHFRRETSQRILGVPDTDPTVHRAWFSPDGRWLLAVDGAGAAQIWDVTTGKSTTEVLEHKSPVTGVSFSADGRHVLTETFLPDYTVRALRASGESSAALGMLISLIRPANTVNVWEVAGGKLVASIGPWSDATAITFRRAAFAPDGRSLLIVSDGEARLWEVAEKRIARRFRKPGADVDRAALSPDGRVLATTSDDDTAQLWNAASGESIPTPIQLRHGGQTWPPLFSADGRLLVLSSRPSGVRVFVAATGDPVSPPLGHPIPVESVTFSSDGRMLLTASDRAARVWSLNADDRTADDWLLLAQLLSCSRMNREGGRPVPLLPDELRAAWDHLRRKSAGAFVVAPKDTITWHSEAARVCEKNGRWSAALPHLERLADKDRERPDLFARRGRAHAEAGQWKRAAADFEKAASLAPDRHAHWFRHALIRLQLGEKDTYQQVRVGMLDRFESSRDLVAAQQAAWAGSLAPAPQKVADRLVAAAERAVKDSPRNHAYLLTLGAALYRANRHEDTVRTLNEAIKIWGKGDTPWDWLYLAMAHHHLGAAEPAKANFDLAVRWIDQRNVIGPDGATTSTLFWSDRLELTLLRREAERALSEPPLKKHVN
jgi:WD40 repeat protein/tetratricopeptide (TPR) repeat protein